MTRHTVQSPDTGEEATVTVEEYDAGVQIHIGHQYAEAAAAMLPNQAVEIGYELVKTGKRVGSTTASVPTTRVCGQNVKVGDAVTVTFATERTVALVGIVGSVVRIRAYDETTGEPICKIDSGKHNPELWFEDVRTRIVVGPIEREEIHSIAQIDGPWISPLEMRQMMGTDPGEQDCAPDAQPVFRSAAN